MLNPHNYLGLGDEYIIITARHKGLHNITKKWLKQWNLTGKVFFIKSISPSIQKAHWIRVAEEKAKILKMEKVDIYIDDNWHTVSHLRKICPETKIIFYGGRINW